MERKQVRKINIHSRRIYLITEKLKALNQSKEKKDYDKLIQEVLDRGKDYAKAQQEVTKRENEGLIGRIDDNNC